VVARIRAGASGIALLALGGLLSACGGSQDVAVSNVAEEFYGSVHRGDGAAACALLAPTTRSELEQSSGDQCAAAILEELTDARSDDDIVEVFGTMAQVRWRGGAVFLTRMSDGWRVLAAGCAPHADAPYDCLVKGA
jgi:hypothetical protein